jgi:pimeloyl-ACP methyl ester carboxylesterase
VYETKSRINKMPKHYEEITITISYGIIAAKAWGHINTDKTILAIHGWQENAGSFDRIIALLPESLHVIAIDLPGHGFSSHLSDGCPYSEIVFYIAIKEIIDKLNLKNIVILAHAMGATLAIYFSCLFPELISKIITFDMINPMCLTFEQLIKHNRTAIELFVTLDQNNIKFDPTYDHQSILEKLMSEHGCISLESAQCLLIRGSKISADRSGYCLTRDNRLEAVLFQQMSKEAIFNYLNSFNCDLLIINSDKFQSDLVLEEREKYLNFYQNKCHYFKYVEIESQYESHIHLCDPKKVISYVLEFLNDFK